MAEATEILRHAAELIDGDRNEQHGPRDICHAEIAKAWTWWLNGKLNAPVSAHDVAMMMSLLKTARIKTGSHNLDCYIDGAGYLGIAGELSTK